MCLVAHAMQEVVARPHILQRKQVVVNAVPLETAAPWWENILVSFGLAGIYGVGICFFITRNG